MKPLFVLLFFILFVDAAAQQSCDPTCDLPARGPVPSEEVAKFKTNYERVYLKTDAARKTHPASVDFSKEAINYFYSANFTGGSKNAGMNVFFLCLSNTGLPGYRHKDQIGLGIFPADMSCKTDFTGLGIYNNSYNQKFLSYKNPKSINKLSKDDWSRFTGHYKVIHQAANPDNYTGRVHFTKDVLEALFIFINKDPMYTGVRFELGIYALPDMACGQVSDNQLTLFISPVLKNGATDYENFIKFYQTTFVNGGRVRILDTYNHGELCPKICPE